MKHALEIYEAVARVVDPVYLVGGSVRDVVMGRACSDYDFTTPLLPDRIEAAVREAGRKPYLIGKKYGTVGFKADGRLVEVTTFRSEVYPDDTRKPNVEFLTELSGDLGRRDFTINAMAMQAEEVIDLFGGRADIDARIIRAVGDPRERFREDPLRMLRAARFASQLDFTVEHDTTAAMERYAHRILHVARERWMIELDKLLVGDNVAYGLGVLARTGLLRFMVPELELQIGYDQNSPHHDRTLFEHTLAVVAAVEPEPALRWAALLHDIAKPFVRAEKPDRSVYHKHDLLGAEIVERLALYLKWSKSRREAVVTLARDHLLETSPLHDADMGAKPPKTP
ncbi:MAG: HDIG domain-containing protein [Coriobacteriia bacterium]|nr:HDIG domain-containing protein [Coriobacteriia bacterium]